MTSLARIVCLAVASALAWLLTGPAQATTPIPPFSQASSTQIQPQPPPGGCHETGLGLFKLPDPDCTPGARNPQVKQSTLTQTICQPGYTKTVRPPSQITRAEKMLSMAAYGQTLPASRYEYDHLISLQLGGAPNDARNLWPELGPVPNQKDKLETRLKKMVCAHQIRLITAQRKIATNWVAALDDIFG